MRLHCPEPSLDLQTSLSLPRTREQRLASKTVAMREDFMIDARDLLLLISPGKVTSREDGASAIESVCDSNLKSTVCPVGSTWW